MHSKLNRLWHGEAYFLWDSHTDMDYKLYNPRLQWCRSLRLSLLWITSGCINEDKSYSEIKPAWVLVKLQISVVDFVKTYHVGDDMLNQRPKSLINLEVVNGHTNFKQKHFHFLYGIIWVLFFSFLILKTFRSFLNMAVLFVPNWFHLG